MYLTIKGLILRVTHYNDTDALLTVLTHTHGKITVKARGLRRKRSPLAASCQLLAYTEFVLFQYRDTYTINECRTIELFQNLRNDLCKLSLGTYFAHVAEVLCQEDIPNPELLSLVLNCLFALTSLDLSEDLVKAVFEMRSICLAGYMPDLSGCICCGNPLPDRFDVGDGALECSTCRRPESNGIRVPLTPGVLESLRYISACDAKQLFRFQVGEATAAELSSVTELYLLTRLERGFSTLDFYKSLQLQ